MEFKPDVKFDPLKKCYLVGDSIAATFSTQDIQISPKDWIGVFNVTKDDGFNNLFTKKLLGEIQSNDDSIFSVAIEIPFAASSDIQYELRYMSQNNECFGKSENFSITSISPAESLITVKEGTSFDENLVLVDKLSFGGIEKNKKKSKNLEEQLQQLKEINKIFKEELDSLSASKEIIQTSLEQEIIRREKAEESLELLSRKLAEQMVFIDKQGDEMEQLRTTIEKQNAISETLREESERAQELIAEVEGIQIAAHTFKSECSKLRKEVISSEDLIDRLKHQILEDRDMSEEHIGRLKDSAQRKLKKLQGVIEETEESLAAERENVHRLTEKLEENKNKYEKESEAKNDQLRQLQEKYENEISEYTGKLHEKENHINKLLKTVSDLESRVCNESSNASRLENELMIVENRYKEATDDVKYFRQKFLEAEQKTQKDQLIITKQRNEINTLKSRQHEFQDNKSESVSACPSNETICESRRRNPGDVTDFTDDECEGVNRSRSVESIIRPAYKERAEAEVIKIDPEAPQSSSSGSSEHSNENSNYLHPITVLDGENRPKKGRRRYGKPIDLNTIVVNTTKKEEPSKPFAKDVTTIDREDLERQYYSIRQHRNSLIRENTYLKNRLNAMNQDMVIMNKNLQEAVFAADYKVGMMSAMLSSNQNVTPTEIQQITSTPTKLNTTNTGSLSPYASEYMPNKQQQQIPVPPPIFLPAPPTPGFFEFIASQQLDNNLPLPLPPTPIPVSLIPQNNNNLLDVTEQLNQMGINISTNN